MATAPQAVVLSTATLQEQDHSDAPVPDAEGHRGALDIDWQSPDSNLSVDPSLCQKGNVNSKPALQQSLSASLGKIASPTYESLIMTALNNHNPAIANESPGQENSSRSSGPSPARSSAPSHARNRSRVLRKVQSDMPETSGTPFPSRTSVISSPPFGKTMTTVLERLSGEAMSVSQSRGVRRERSKALSRKKQQEQRETPRTEGAESPEPSSPTLADYFGTVSPRGPGSLTHALQRSSTGPRDAIPRRGSINDYVGAQREEARRDSIGGGSEVKTRGEGDSEASIVLSAWNVLLDRGKVKSGNLLAGKNSKEPQQTRARTPPGGGGGEVGSKAGGWMVRSSSVPAGLADSPVALPLQRAAAAFRTARLRQPLPLPATGSRARKRMRAPWCTARTPPQA